MKMYSKWCPTIAIGFAAGVCVQVFLDVSIMSGTTGAIRLAPSLSMKPSDSDRCCQRRARVQYSSR